MSLHSRSRRTHYDDYVQQDYDETHPAEPRYQDGRIEQYKAQMQQRAYQEAYYEQQDYGVDDSQPAPRKPPPIARKMSTASSTNASVWAVYSAVAKTIL